MSRNPHYQALINTWKWQQLRAAKLKAQPLCEECERRGIVRAATEVHHIRPVGSALTPEGMKTLAYDRNNLMSVCVQCHQDLHAAMPKSRRPKTKRYQKKLQIAEEAKAFADRFLPKQEEDNGNI